MLSAFTKRLNKRIQREISSAGEQRPSKLKMRVRFLPGVPISNTGDKMKILPTVIFLLLLGFAVTTSAETFSLTWWIFHAWAALVHVVLIPFFASMVLAEGKSFRHVMKLQLKNTKPAPWSRNTDTAISLSMIAGFATLSWMVPVIAAVLGLCMSQYVFGLRNEIEKENL